MKFVPKAYFSILSETDFNQFYKIWCVKQIGTKKLHLSEFKNASDTINVFHEKFNND